MYCLSWQDLLKSCGQPHTSFPKHSRVRSVCVINLWKKFGLRTNSMRDFFNHILTSPAAHMAPLEDTIVLAKKSTVLKIGFWKAAWIWNTDLPWRAVYLLVALRPISLQCNLGTLKFVQPKILSWHGKSVFKSAVDALISNIQFSPPHFVAFWF